MLADHVCPRLVSAGHVHESFVDDDEKEYTRLGNKNINDKKCNTINIFAIDRFPLFNETKQYLNILYVWKEKASHFFAEFLTATGATIVQSLVH
jgi:hypothetical protein